MSAFTLPLHQPPTGECRPRAKTMCIRYSSGHSRPLSNWTQMITDVTLDADRTAMIVRVLLAIPTPRRKVIVVSHRIEHLDAIFRELTLARMHAGDAGESNSKGYRECTPTANAPCQ